MNIEFCEKVIKGLLSQGVTPLELILALYNSLACGKGHELAGITINKMDDWKFTQLMQALDSAQYSAKGLES
jgi:hypothetical protein